MIQFLFWCVFRCFPVAENKVVISSYYGRGYGDNPKYITEAIQKENSSIKIIWLIRNDKEKGSLPHGVEMCQWNSIKRIYHLSTANVWIDNCRKSFGFKRKNQLYVQTWHGFALKRIEKDAECNLGRGYLKIAQKDSKYIDYIVSCSQFMTQIYRNSFWYDGPVLEWGAPRNDMLLSDCSAVKNKVYEFYNLDCEIKTVLYAPTFRSDGSMEPYSISYMRLIDACERRFGGKFVVLVRLHPNIAKKSEELGTMYTSNVINATYYPDMQELLGACDIVISDYSSLMFDFALSMKPCFQFATDIDAYKGDRNFYFEITNLPFSLAVNNDELENNIVMFDDAGYRNRLSDFYKSVGMVMNGDASEKCAKLIIEHCKIQHGRRRGNEH